MRYSLYNADVKVAKFRYTKGTIRAFEALRPELLPKQIQNATPEGFSLWIQERAIDLNTFQHRQLAKELTGSRDKISISLATHMFSISDTFTCFKDPEFKPRNDLCHIEDQNTISDFILVSSDTSLRLNTRVTPNISTDGSFPKTWKFERKAWWLYKLQSKEATRSEREISKVLMSCNWDAAEYQYVGTSRTQIRSKNFVGKDEFFEPYDSLRFMFEDKSDDEQTIYDNLASLGQDFEKSYRRILLADALFYNTDRHMRNFGVIRCAKTGQILRMAPNFDNNQAYRTNPGGFVSDGMLRMFKETFGLTAADIEDLNTLIEACRMNKYLVAAAEMGERFLNN